jgi:hypothetical protein
MPQVDTRGLTYENYENLFSRSGLRNIFYGEMLLNLVWIGCFRQVTENTDHIDLINS